MIAGPHTYTTQVWVRDEILTAGMPLFDGVGRLTYLLAM